MKIELYNKHPKYNEYFYAELEMPASRYVIHDALHRVRFFDGDTLEFNISECPEFPEIKGMNVDRANIFDLNNYAYKLNEMKEYDLVAMRAVFTRRQSEGMYKDGIMMGELINLAYGLEGLPSLVNINNTLQLGQFVIDNDMNPDLEGLDASVLDLIDRNALGVHQADTDMGIFIDGYYIATANYELPDIYKDSHLEDSSYMTAFLEKKPTPKLSLEEEIALTKKMFPPLEAKELIELQIKNAELYNVKRAAVFLKVLRYSYSSTGKSFGSQPFDIRCLFDLIEKVSGRLQPVVIENKDFQAVMEQYDRENALIYCDPPYFDTENMYKGGFTMDDHMRLFNTFREAKGKVLISYNDCPIARKTYEDYCIMSFSRVHSMAQKYEPGKEFHELLIANYDILEREKNKPYQLTIFDSGESAEVSNLLKGSVIHYGRKII